MGIDNKYMVLTGKRNGALNIRTNDYLYDLAGAAIVAESGTNTGYIKYASGLILQWGSNGTMDSGAIVTINLPISFVRFSKVLITPITRSNDTIPQLAILNNDTLSNFQVKTSLLAHGFMWFAIG